MESRYLRKLVSFGVVGGLTFWSVLALAAPPRNADDFKVIANKVYPILAGSGRFNKNELAKLRRAIAGTEVALSVDPLPFVGGEKAVVDLQEDEDGIIELKIDRESFDESLKRGSGFRVVSQTYLTIADLSPGLVDEAGTNGETVNGELEKANRDYLRVNVQTNIQLNIYPNARTAPRYITQQPAPAPSVASPPSHSPAIDPETQRVLDEADRVLASSARTLANRLPPYVPRSHRPDYEAMTKDIVAPYQAAAQLVRAKGDVKRARSESECTCKADCIFYKGVARETARSYDFSVSGAGDDRKGCRSDMSRTCRGLGGVGQGTWGNNLVDESFTLGCGPA